MKTYTYHIDSGHGWLEVPAADFLGAGLTFDQVKHYSYAQVTKMYVPTLYLEEDCHMPLFLSKLEDKGVEYKLVEQYHDGDAFVRDLGRVA